MEFRAKIIEQLDEATIQIDKQTITGSRLALILLDNAIEITMYDFIKNELLDEFDIFSTDDLDSVKPDKLYPEFNNKTQYLASNEIISYDEKNLIDTCHSYRNEVYHTSISRDSIINQIAKIYLQNCGAIIPKLFHAGWIIDYEVYPIFHKYLGESKITKLSKDKMEDITSTMCNSRTCTQEEFSKTLSIDIMNRVQTLNDNLEYIKIRTNNEMPESLNYVFDKINSFTKRAEKLGKVSSASNAIVRYFKLDKDLITIESDVETFGIIIGYMEDMAIDAYRGK